MLSFASFGPKFLFIVLKKKSSLTQRGTDKKRTLFPPPVLCSTHSELLALPAVHHVLSSSSGPLQMLFPFPGILFSHCPICLPNTTIFKSQLKFDNNWEDFSDPIYVPKFGLSAFFLYVVIAYHSFPTV